MGVSNEEEEENFKFWEAQRTSEGNSWNFRNWFLQKTETNWMTSVVLYLLNNLFSLVSPNLCPWGPKHSNFASALLNYSGLQRKKMKVNDGSNTGLVNWLPLKHHRLAHSSILECRLIVETWVGAPLLRFTFLQKMFAGLINIIEFSSMVRCICLHLDVQHGAIGGWTRHG